MSNLIVNCFEDNQECNTVPYALKSEYAVVSAHNDQRGSNSATVTPQHGQNISAGHYECLIEELKCPGCAYPMRAPIFICQTGHSVCDKCTQILSVCPLCKVGFTPIRSLTLEAISSKAYFRCSNFAAGCTVRMQTELLDWHEKQCMYKVMKCFMGRIWGNCTWIGREITWKEHLLAEHSEKVFDKSPTAFRWNMHESEQLRPLSAYYVFNLYCEMFNLYQIYDKTRVLWTMACTSTIREKKLLFSYDVEVYNPEDESAVITQRYPCHSEFDKDILQEGTCVSVALTDILRLLSSDKILHYRIRVNQVKNIRRSTSPSIVPKAIPIDFKQTQIEGVNLKNVPQSNILTRKVEELEISDYHVASGSYSSNSDMTAQLQAKWGTPQLNFNRKFLRNQPGISSESDSTSSNQSVKEDLIFNADKSAKYDHGDNLNRLKMRKMTSSLRKSLRTLKAEFVELKTLGKQSIKRSPTNHSIKPLDPAVG